MRAEPGLKVVADSFDADADAIPLHRDAADQKPYSPIGESVVSFDRHGRIVYFDGAAEKLFGYSAEELVGCRIGVLVPIRFHAQHREATDGLLVPGAPIRRSTGIGSTVAGLHKNGQELAVEVRLSRSTNADQQTLTAAVRLVTSQR